MEQPQHKRTTRVFAYVMVGSLLALLLPRRWTDQPDHLLSLLLSPMSGSSRAALLAVTEHLRQPPPGTLTAEEVRWINLAAENRALRQRNEQLAGLRRAGWPQRVRFLQAEVVGSDSGPRRQIKTLNLGARDGVRKDQIVLAAAGVEPDFTVPGTYDYQMCVVGRIFAVGEGSSTLQLLTDPEFRLLAAIVPVEDSQTWRADGVLTTEPGQLPSVVMVPANLPVRPGDAVLARANPQFLPIELLVGTVKSCRRHERTPVVWQISMHPAVDLNTLGQVVVVDTSGPQGAGH